MIDACKVRSCWSKRLQNIVRDAWGSTHLSMWILHFLFKTFVVCRATLILMGLVINARNEIPQRQTKLHLEITLKRISRISALTGRPTSKYHFGVFRHTQRERPGDRRILYIASTYFHGPVPTSSDSQPGKADRRGCVSTWSHKFPPSPKAVLCHAQGNSDDPVSPGKNRNWEVGSCCIFGSVVRLTKGSTHT